MAIRHLHFNHPQDMKLTIVLLCLAVFSRAAPTPEDVPSEPEGRSFRHKLSHILHQVVKVVPVVINVAPLIHLGDEPARSGDVISRILQTPGEGETEQQLSLSPRNRMAE